MERVREETPRREIIASVTCIEIRRRNPGFPLHLIHFRPLEQSVARTAASGTEPVLFSDCGEIV